MDKADYKQKGEKKVVRMIPVMKIVDKKKK